MPIQIAKLEALAYVDPSPGKSVARRFLFRAFRACRVGGGGAACRDESCRVFRGGSVAARGALFIHAMGPAPGARIVLHVASTPLLAFFCFAADRCCGGQGSTNPKYSPNVPRRALSESQTMPLVRVSSGYTHTRAIQARFETPPT
ncbi:hypothetical protein MTO96_006925 [Rhipicephalus appendiculatus]